MATKINHEADAVAQDCCAEDGVLHSTPLGQTRHAAGASLPTYRVPTMDCAAEETEIRQALDSIDGIRRLHFSLTERTIGIDAPAERMPRILQAIRGAGFDPQPVVSTAPDATASAGAQGDKRWVGLLGGARRFAAALLLAIVAESIAYFAPPALPWTVAGMAIAVAAIWLAGFDTYKKGIAALRQGRLNINALMSVAVTGAFLIGQWPEAAMVMALYGIAELIEARAVDRARNAITRLMDLAPDLADVRQADGSWRNEHATDVAIGSIVRIKPGERAPLDGAVTAGTSAINQAPVTGESMPVEKSLGDPVFAGTINETGVLELRVTAAASDSTLARIIHAVEQAQQARAPTQRFVDRFAAIYTPAVFVIALAVALLSPWLFGWTWTVAAYKALVLLVIACPCALVISTPVTIVSGLAAAARHGILIKGGTYLEEARKLRAVAVDKTGTLTQGKPRLVHWEVLAKPASSLSAETLAASLAMLSDHPVSRAIASGLDGVRSAVVDFKAIPGRGVEGLLPDGLFTLANHRLIEERGLCSRELEAKLAEHESQGRTVTLLASTDRVLALFAVADIIKPSSRAAIADLYSLGVAPVMLTGDNQATAATIGAQAGVRDVRGSLLPQDKLDAIRDIQSRVGPTAMAGDGINDAPALAQADIGIAMGAAGTDIAMEAADVVIMNDDLRNIARTVRLSRATHHVLWQNIVLALGIKVIFLVFALFGNATMWMAVFADMGASLLVVGNGLRLLRR